MEEFNTIDGGPKNIHRASRRSSIFVPTTESGPGKEVLNSTEDHGGHSKKDHGNVSVIVI